MQQDYRFAHTCIRVMDLEKSVKFYEEAFGFKVSRKKDFPDDEFTLVYLTDKNEDFELELTYNYDRKEPYTIGNGYSHLAVFIEDLQASYKFHKEQGYKVGNIHRLSEGSSGFYFVTDPDGYEIEVIQR